MPGIKYLRIHILTVGQLKLLNTASVFLRESIISFSTWHNIYYHNKKVNAQCLHYSLLYLKQWLLNLSVLGVHWKDWCWSWISSTLATSWEELTHWKSPWCWEGLGAGGEGDDRGWDGWMASPTRCTWVWVNSGSWWWIGRPNVLQFMGLQRVGQDWATELNWTDTAVTIYKDIFKCRLLKRQLSVFKNFWNVDIQKYAIIWKIWYIYKFSCFKHRGICFTLYF